MHTSGTIIYIDRGSSCSSKSVQQKIHFSTICWIEHITAVKRRKNKNSNVGNNINAPLKTRFRAEWVYMRCAQDCRSNVIRPCVVCVCESASLFVEQIAMSMSNANEQMERKTTKKDKKKNTNKTPAYETISRRGINQLYMTHIRILHKCLIILYMEWLQNIKHNMFYTYHKHLLSS